MRRRKKARRKPEVEITEIDKATTWSPALYEVHQDRVLLGFLEKYRDTRDETHPWKAMGIQFVPGRRPMVGDMVGVFYAHEGGKKAAIEALRGLAPNPAGKKMDDVLNEIENFYHDMHHNVSTMHLDFQELQDDFSEEMFLDFLGFEAKEFTRELSEYVKEKYGEELTFSQYGRMGATMLPDQWTWESVSGRGIDVDKAVGSSREYDTELERYNRACKVLKILKDVNKQIEVAVRHLPSAWKEFIEANA